MITKSKKQFEEQKKVAALIVDVKKGAEEIKTLAITYKTAAKEAMKMGRDASAKEYMSCCVALRRFSEDIDFIVLQLQTYAVTSKSLAKLSGVPAAIRTCMDLLKKGPDLAKLSEQMANMRNLTQDTFGAIADMRAGLSQGTISDGYTTTLTADNDPENARRLAELESELIAELAADASVPGVVAAPIASTVTATAGDDARVDAIAGMFDDVRKGGK